MALQGVFAALHMYAYVSQKLGHTLARTLHRATNVALL